MNRHRTLLGCALVFIAAGCTSVSVDPSRELTVGLSADRSEAAPLEEIEFSVEATGTQLFGVIIRFGDSQVDSVGVAGASKMTANLRHAYESPGVYSVTATAEERSGRSISDSLVVRIRSR